MSNLMRRAAREPLLHFLVLGALIFLLYGLIGERARNASNRIEVGAADIARLRALSQKQWGREPDARQLDALVRDFVREEVLVREALVGGMDREDVIVRRRLAQKMEFLAHEEVRSPDESEQRAWFAAHAERYLQPAVLDLEQLYFSAADAAQAAPALVALQRNQTPHSDNFMLARALTMQDKATLARDFGERFATVVFAMPPGVWQGPLASAHGVHLVRVTRRVDASPARFADMQVRVAADMVNARIAAARDAAYAKLLAHYTVVIDPEVTAAQPSLAISVSHGGKL
jgi:hypothetical protein